LSRTPEFTRTVPIQAVLSGVTTESVGVAATGAVSSVFTVTGVDNCTLNGTVVGTVGIIFEAGAATKVSGVESGAVASPVLGLLPGRKIPSTAGFSLSVLGDDDGLRVLGSVVRDGLLVGGNIGSFVVDGLFVGVARGAGVLDGLLVGDEIGSLVVDGLLLGEAKVVDGLLLGKSKEVDGLLLGKSKIVDGLLLGEAKVVDGNLVKNLLPPPLNGSGNILASGPTIGNGKMPIPPTGTVLPPLDGRLPKFDGIGRLLPAATVGN
jgi:hypothetical protein